jgi:hypothetical protein
MRAAFIPTAMVLAFASGFGLSGAVCAQSVSDGPRQLSPDDIAKLRARIASDKQAREEEAIRQEEERRIAEAEAEAAADYYYDEPVQSTPAPNLAEVFTKTFSQEYNKNMEIVNRGNANVAAARQGVIDEQRRREAQQRAEAVRREVEAARRKRAEAAAAAAAGARPGSGVSAGGGQAAGTTPASPQATAAEERARKLREQVAAERQRLAEQERQRTMKGFVESSRARDQQQATIGDAVSGKASVSASPTPVAAPRDYGPAKAWCQASENGTYQCMGPLQRMIGWEKSLDYALSTVGCGGGRGYNPTPGTGGKGFDCGRSLRVGDFRMPLYDPFRGGGNPVRVTDSGQ